MTTMSQNLRLIWRMDETLDCLVHNAIVHPQLWTSTTPKHSVGGRGSNSLLTWRVEGFSFQLLHILAQFTLRVRLWWSQHLQKSWDTTLRSPKQTRLQTESVTRNSLGRTHCLLQIHKNRAATCYKWTKRLKAKHKLTDPQTPSCEMNIKFLMTRFNTVNIIHIVPLKPFVAILFWNIGD